MNKFNDMICGVVVAALGLMLSASAVAGSPACDKRVNNTHNKLQECVTLDGVNEHRSAFQAIADANGGTRATGTSGYDASVDYVAAQLDAAGYNVTIQQYLTYVFEQLGPSTLEQIAPGSVVYTEDVDYNLMSNTDPGDVTAPVTAVDLDLGLGNSSTSGCEPADFAGFPPGNIALMQRGACSFLLKAENAAAAGAVGAIIFNQGNTVDRQGLFNGTVSAEYSGGIPVLGATYALGEDLNDEIPGLTVRIVADVSRGDVVAANVIAESIGGDPRNVVIAGAHLDSPPGSPGINSNGSGAAALLEVAEQMAKVKPRNKVRFAWWGSRFNATRGSDYYVADLTPDEIDDIALYLEFATIGSPNFVRFVYDGDGSEGGTAGAPGSEAIEALFSEFYAARGLASEPIPYRFSDDLAFYLAGIPTGGIYTGTFEIKSPDQVLLYGGAAGDQLDPCYVLACDTFDNVSFEVLEQSTAAVAYSVLQYAMSTKPVNGKEGKGNFK